MASSKLGQGLAFPLLPVDGGWQWVRGGDAVEQALRTLLLTQPGERLAHRKWGVGLRRFLFQPNSVATRAALRKVITDAVAAHEPRVKLSSVDIHSDAEQPSLLHIELRYTLVSDPGPRSLVFPFYLDGQEG